MNRTYPEPAEERAPLVMPAGCMIEPELIVLERIRHHGLAVLTEREAAIALCMKQIDLGVLRLRGGGPAHIVINRTILYRLDALSDWLAHIERPMVMPHQPEVA